ncbi:hypothetical protein OUZ56_031465 [Daphnia magna]|uniref:Cuticular protein n=2 Tax=Daphnia magna TaxID=35525 RepID=A0ABQ9ZVF8_9CRUS|nr:hypothetical protein OUZ56_031465 [Daphnia magna]
MQFSIGAVMLAMILLGHGCLGQRQQEQLDVIEPEQQTQERRPHVAILKQINQINKDGSYTYGFEASDGSFRVETRDVNGHVKGRYGYIDEFGEVKAVAYESGKAQGFAPRGQHLPALPRPSKSGGNIGEDDEFGTDEDWNSVDADQDGIPDKPRPKEERPVVTTKPPRTTPRPTRPAAVFTAAEDAPQPVRPLPRPTLIPVEDMPQSLRPFQPFQQQRPQFQPQQFQLQPQQFRFQPQPQDVQQFRDDRQQQRFSEPIFPSQFRSIPAGFPQQRSFDSVPFSFQPQQPRE